MNLAFQAMPGHLKGGESCSYDGRFSRLRVPVPWWGASRRTFRPKRPRLVLAGGASRIGQIGVGHGHASKLSVYRASPDYEVVGVVEPDAALRSRAETQPAFRGVTWMTREQLLDTPGLDAVLVETRVRDLLEAAEACVAAGKAVHLDKPAGASLPRFRRLLDTAAEKRLFVQMGYMYRYNPAVVLLRRVLSRGWLGEPFEVHAVMSKVVEPAERRKLAEFPGGMMFELGCHLIDLVVGVLGKPEAVTPFRQHAGAAADGLADNTLAVFRYPRAGEREVERDGGRRLRPPASRRLRYRGDIPHRAAR